MKRRMDVAFISGQQGDHCRAWLYEPEGSGPFPVIVMAHGLGGIREMRLDAFAERFSLAGYACLVFDYRHFGASDGLPRQLLDIGRQLEDWANAVAFARHHSDLRPGQVIAWGTSFSGGHVIVTAAHDRELAAVIAQCPFTDGIASALAMSWQSSLKVTAWAVCDVLRSAVGLRPLFVASAGRPRSTALMTSPDALAGYLALVPRDAPFQNRVAARIALGILRYRPGRSAANVACPILFCISQADSITPARPSLRYARTAPRAEILLYADRHFDTYMGDAFDRIVNDQLAFLQRCVPTTCRPEWGAGVSQGM
jgi:pimeloyl-ACP methyl ester carboxylesterase